MGAASLDLIFTLAAPLRGGLGCARTPRTLYPSELYVTARDPLATLETEWPWLEIYVKRLPDTYAQTVWTDGKPYIEIAHDLGPVTQRVALAHEMQHLVAGKPCTSYCGENERQVVDATARWLLPDAGEVGEALNGRSLRQAAAALQVTTEVLMQRLAALTADEQAVIDDIIPAGTDPPPGGLRVAHGPRRVVETRRGHTCREARSRTPQPPLARPEKDARPDQSNDSPAR